MIFGPLFIVVLIGLIWLEGWLGEHYMSGLVFLPVLCAIIAAAAVELNAIFRAEGLSTGPRFTAVAAVIGVLLTSFVRESMVGVSGVALAATSGVAVQLGAMLFYSRKRVLKGVTAASSATLLAFIYLGVLGGFLFVIRRDFGDEGVGGEWVVLGILLVVKSCDIGAYFTGRAIGKHKLLPWVSPSKTWEGLIGGLAMSALVCSGLTALAQARSFPIPFEPVSALAIGALFGLVGQGGDLVASMLKRDAGIKDASSIIPGFGGVLDVIDSPLLVAPVAYWILVVATPA
ncbi:MAG: phosphatidate cytidylyltransferase [Planctomycetota bacterium]